MSDNNNMLAEKECDDCHERFKDNAELGLHFRKFHKNYFCAPCKKEFDTHEQLVGHLKNVHGLTSATGA